MAKTVKKASTGLKPKTSASPTRTSVKPSVSAAINTLTKTTAALNKISTAPAGPSSLAPNFAAEIGAIDFKKMISGPLQACVDAQVASSLACVEFINAVGFKTDANGDKELVMVDFTHEKTDVDSAGNPVVKKTFIKVPLLAMVQVPSLRIEHVIIDFNVKLSSVETANTSTSIGVDASAQGGWGPVNFKVSASFKRTSSTGIKVEREYALNVNVKAVQDEIAPGLSKILELLAA